MLKKILLLLLLAICVDVELMSQGLPLNIENATDQQLLQIISQYQLSGLTESELETKARERGMGTDQIMLLKKRMALLDPGSSSGLPVNSAYNNKTDSYVDRNRITTKGPSIRSKDSSGQLLMPFGTDIFDNIDLSFEPNAQLASPTNYVIGSGDQLVVDVYGLSENTKKLKVTPDGFIRYPNLGPIRVAGSSLELARQKITKSLTTIYPAIATGRTKVEVTLGQIRSIRITVIGEVYRPGNFTMSSMATVMHALYACGGPNQLGSLRKVSVVRGGRTIVALDVYDFLMKGNLSKNILLQDDDVIQVSTYALRVGIKGAVKKQALFDLMPGENAGTLLTYAGGFTDKAKKDFVRVKRWGNNTREILTVPFSQLASFEMMSGDTLLVDHLASWTANRVVVTGAVNYPGEFGLNEVRDLSSLLKMAQPSEQAYAERAMLIRKKEDFNPVYIPFSLKEVLEGKNNIPLQQEDSIHILRNADIRQLNKIRVNGEVNRPDEYPFAEGMRVQDIILLAGGLKQGASLQRIEISRRLNSTNNQDTGTYSIIKSIDLEDGLRFSQNEADVVLQPFDIVSIRKSPSYKEQINVSVEGEVVFPGTYSLSGTKDRLSDIISRAGGLKQTSFSAGAILVRKTYLGTSNADAAIFNNKLNLINTQQKGNSQMLATSDTAQVRMALENISAQHKPVAIHLDKAIANPGSAEDLLLEEGDVLKVPRLVQTVQLFGAVNVPQQLAYNNRLTVKKLVRRSGGFTVQAARSKLYVVQQNGVVHATRRFLFIRLYPKLVPGAEVFVPLKKENRKLTPGEVIGFSTSLISLGGLIIALLNITK